VAKWSDDALDVLGEYFDGEEQARVRWGGLDEGATDIYPLCGVRSRKRGLPNHLTGGCKKSHLEPGHPNTLKN
jgi:hypothetical protein